MALKTPNQTDEARQASEAAQAAEQTERKQEAEVENSAPAPEMEQVDESSINDTADNYDANPEPIVDNYEAPAQTSTQVAESKPAQAPAVQRQSASSQTLSELADLGMEDVGLSSLGFDRIVIGNGDFQHGQAKDSIGREIKVKIEKSQNIQLVTRSDDDSDTNLFYTYDKNPLGNPEVVDTEGRPRGHEVAEWRAEGFEEQMSFRTYKEAMVEILECAEASHLEGEYAVLSIPPASRSRFDAQLYVATNKLKRRNGGQLPENLDIIAHCKVGKAVKNGNNTYNPWDVKFTLQQSED